MPLPTVVISIPIESPNGVLGPGWYGRYPQGDAPANPGQGLAGGAADSNVGVATITLGAKALRGAAADGTVAAGTLTKGGPGKVFAGPAADILSATGRISSAAAGAVVKYHPGYYGCAGMAGVGGGGTAPYTDTSVTPPVTYQVNTNFAGFLNNQLHGNCAALSGLFTSIHATQFQPGAQGVFAFDGSVNDPFLSYYLAAQGFWRTEFGIAKGDQCRVGMMVGWAQNTGASNNTRPLVLGSQTVGGTGAGYTFSGSSGPVPPFIRDCAINGNRVTNYLGSGKTVGFVDMFDNVGYTQQANGPTIWQPGGSTTRYFFGIQAGAGQSSGFGQCGHTYTGYTGANYITIYPTTWEKGTEKDRANTLFALSVYKLPYTDSTGKTVWLTLDQHPLVEFMWLADETSANIDQSEAAMRPISIDNVAFPAGNLCCATGYWNSKFDAYTTLCNSFPHTVWGDAHNFQFRVGLPDDDDNQTYNKYLPYIAANFKTMALCGPDTLGASWVTPGPQATTAQQAFVGIPSPANSGAIGAIVLSASLQGIMDVVAQVQDPDWNHHFIGTHGAYTLATGADIFAAGSGNGNTPGLYTLGAGRSIVWNTTDRFQTTDWGGSPIYDSIVAAATATPLNTVVPSNLRSPLQFAVSGAAAGALNKKLEIIVAVTNDAGPVTWTQQGPAWLNAPQVLDPLHVLVSGIPNATGPVAITLHATSTSSGNTGTLVL